MERSRAWIGLAAGLVLLAGGLIGIAVDLRDSPDGFGDPPTSLGPATSGTSSPADVPPDGQPPERDHGTAEDSSGQAEERDEDASSAPTVATRPARLEDHEADPEPVFVEVERLGISAPVDPVGVRPDGAMEIPADVERAGWFGLGPAPGSPVGSSVITAHVDSRDEGPGVFFPLREAQEGDGIVVVDAEGDVIEYTVTALAHYGKSEVPMADLFQQHGPHRLVLITCGGEWDEDARSYSENVVVIAEPAT